MLKRLAAAKNKAESRAGGKTIYSMEKTREAYRGRIFIKREILLKEKFAFCHQQWKIKEEVCCEL